MKYIYISLIFLTISTQITFSADSSDTWCLWSSFYSKYNENCKYKNNYDLYECRVVNLCNSCNTWNSKKIYETTNFKNADNYKKSSYSLNPSPFNQFYEVQKIYKTNMNSIYKCALIDSQERSLDLIENIISSSDKTWILKNDLQPKINSEKTKLNMKKTALNCWSLSNDDTTLDKTLMKKAVLDQTSFELCKYTFYLDYLKSYYNYNQNLLWISDEELQDTNISTNITVIGNSKTQIYNLINNEQNRIYKIFPIAFYAYSEYEENYPMHLLLSIIKEDYSIVKDLLAKVLWPINQVVYKIKDAMKNY